MRYLGEEEYCGLYSETHRKVTKAIKCWAGGEEGRKALKMEERKLEAEEYENK